MNKQNVLNNKTLTLKFDYWDKISVGWHSVDTFSLSKIPDFACIVLTACCYMKSENPQK